MVKGERVKMKWPALIIGLALLLILGSGCTGKKTHAL